MGSFSRHVDCPSERSDQADSHNLLGDGVTWAAAWRGEFDLHICSVCNKPKNTACASRDLYSDICFCTTAATPMKDPG